MYFFLQNLYFFHVVNNYHNSIFLFLYIFPTFLSSIFMKDCLYLYIDAAEKAVFKEISL